MSGGALPIEIDWNDTFTVASPCTPEKYWLPKASCHSTRRAQLDLLHPCPPPARIESEIVTGGVAPRTVYHCVR